MKILISENRLNRTIKNYIMEMYPNVYDVYFTTIKKTLGSTDGQPTVEETVIHIIINNSENKFQLSELDDIRKEITKSVDTVFNLEYDVYGSLWDFQFHQIAVVKLNLYLDNLRK